MEPSYEAFTAEIPLDCGMGLVIPKLICLLCDYGMVGLLPRADREPCGSNRRRATAGLGRPRPRRILVRAFAVIRAIPFPNIACHVIGSTTPDHGQPSSAFRLLYPTQNGLQINNHMGHSLWHLSWWPATERRPSFGFRPFL